MSKMEKREARKFYLYTAPWLIGFLILTLYPMIYSLYLSFTDMNLTGQGKFVKFENYIYAFTKDPLFFKAFFNTLKYVVMFVPMSLILAFFIALLLSKKVKGLGFFRTAFYIPYITSGVAVTILWGWIFNPDYGIINYVLSLFGIKGPNWLGDQKVAMISIVILSLWTIGNNIIIMLAGIQDIPRSYYESAEIDGAGSVRQVFSITLPLCTPTIYFNLIVTFISAFQIFQGFHPVINRVCRIIIFLQYGHDRFRQRAFVLGKQQSHTQIPPPLNSKILPPNRQRPFRNAKCTAKQHPFRFLFII